MHGAAFFVSVGVGALSEMGDKTQLLTVALAARFRRPAPILFGILAAILVGHAVAVGLGAMLARVAAAGALHWVLVSSFVLMALWTVFSTANDSTTATTSRLGVIATSFLAYSLMEMGDKTQIATVVLAAQYPSFISVLAGTTCGMMLADTPAVFLGRAFAGRLPLCAMRGATALMFIGLAVATVVTGGFNFHLPGSGPSVGLTP